MIVVERSREPGNAPAVFVTGTAASSPGIGAAWPVSKAAACRAACFCIASGNRRGIALDHSHLGGQRQAEDPGGVVGGPQRWRTGWDQAADTAGGGQRRQVEGGGCRGGDPGHQDQVARTDDDRGQGAPEPAHGGPVPAGRAVSTLCLARHGRASTRRSRRKRAAETSRGVW